MKSDLSIPNETYSNEEVISSDLVSLLIIFRWIALGSSFLYDWSYPVQFLNLPSNIAQIISNIVIIYVVLSIFNLINTILSFNLNNKTLRFIILGIDVLLGIAISFFYPAKFIILAFALPMIECSIFFGFAPAIYLTFFTASIHFGAYFNQYIYLRNHNSFLPIIVVFTSFLNIILIIFVSLWAFWKLAEERDQQGGVLKRFQEEKKILMEEIELANKLKENSTSQLENKIKEMKEILSQQVEEIEQHRNYIKEMENLGKEKDERLAEITILIEVNQVISLAKTLDETLQAIERVLAKLVPCQTCGIFLTEDIDGRKKLQARLISGPYTEYLRNFVFEIGEGVIGWIALERKPVVMSNGEYVQDDNFGVVLHSLLKYEQSVLAVPIIYEDIVTGVIYLSKGGQSVYNQTHVRILETVAQQAGVAIEKARQQKDVETTGSIIDELTGLYNSRYFHERISEEVKRAKRYHLSTSLLMIDIDYVEKYKDPSAKAKRSFDVILQEISQMVRSYVRETDVITRYDENKFAIILIQSNKSNAILVAERIRLAIEMRLFATESAKRQGAIIVSLGVSAFPEDARTKLELLGKAEKMVLEAKQKGGNRTCFL